VVVALRYKPEGRGFDSGWCHWNFSLTQSFRPHYGPGVDSASCIYMDLRLVTPKTCFYLLHNVSTSNQCRNFPVSQLCVNTLPAPKVTLITNGF
jgi:hypothetical protein